MRLVYNQPPPLERFFHPSHRERLRRPQPTSSFCGGAESRLKRIVADRLQSSDGFSAVGDSAWEVSILDSDMFVLRARYSWRAQPFPQLIAE